MAGTRKKGKKDIERIEIAKGRRGDFSPLQPDHYHNFYEIFYLLSGHSDFLLKDTVYHLEKGDLVFIAPGELHHSLYNSDCEVCMIYFRPEYRLIQSFPLPHSFKGSVPALYHEPFHNLLSRMISENANADEYSEAFMASYLQEILLMLMRHSVMAEKEPELLDANTFNLQSGEWKERVDEYNELERDATILRERLPVEYRNTYNELIYFPVRAMANLYEMYYAVAMNRYYAEQNDPRANEWAEKVQTCFTRDAELCDDYNHKTAGGKWNHMMDEIHIGYRSWNNPPKNIMPEVMRVEAAEETAKEFAAKPYAIVLEAADFTAKTDAAEAAWQVIPDFGIYQSGIALFPYTKGTTGASVTYEFLLPDDAEQVNLILLLAPTFPFNSGRGQRLAVSVDGSPLQTLNVNEANRYIRNGYRDQNYEWETTRVNKQRLSLSARAKGQHTLTLSPLDPGIVIERIIIE